MTSNTTYAYSVSAFDSTGNESARSTTVSAKTLASSTKLLGTAANDTGRGVAIDSNGNVYVTGWTGGDLDGQSNPGQSDIFLTKFDNLGVKQWTRLIGTSGVQDPTNTLTPQDHIGLNVAINSAGTAVYVTGYTVGNMDGQAASGGKDIFLVKYTNVSGGSPTKEWTRLLGTTADDVGTSVALDGSGNVYITGYTSGALGSANAGDEDIFLAKYDPSGTQQWIRQVGTSGQDIGSGVGVSSVGATTYAYITGATLGNLGGQSNPSLGSEYSAFLLQYDVTSATPPASPSWTRLLGTAGADAGLGIASSFGYAVITGFTSGDLDGSGNRGGYDVFVAEYNSSGVQSWFSQQGSSGDDIGYGVAYDSIGNSYVTGFVNGIPSGLLYNGNYAGLEDMFLMKFGLAGDLFNVAIIGNSSENVARGVAIDNSGGFAYVTGFTEDNFDGQPNAGGYDAFLMKFDLGANLL